ncbi:MAG: hypothetical protein AB7U73_06655 [Pirellulales bacterium]
MATSPDDLPNDRRSKGSVSTLHRAAAWLWSVKFWWLAPVIVFLLFYLLLLLTTDMSGASPFRYVLY